MAAGCCGCLRPRVDAVVHYSTQARPHVTYAWTTHGAYAKVIQNIDTVHTPRCECWSTEVSAVLTEEFADRSMAHVESQRFALLGALGCV